MMKYYIWTSDVNIDDWRDDYPDVPDYELYEIAIEQNLEHLEDEMMNLDIQLDEPILCIGDLGLWYGRRQGYREIESGNIADCLKESGDMLSFYVNEVNDLCCKMVHHDGTNYYTYRVWKNWVSEKQKEQLREKLYLGTATRKDIIRKTSGIGKRCKEVYGWK